MLIGNMGFPGESAPASAGDAVLVVSEKDALKEEMASPQHSGLENPMERGACRTKQQQ